MVEMEGSSSPGISPKTPSSPTASPGSPATPGSPTPPRSRTPSRSPTTPRSRNSPDDPVFKSSLSVLLNNQDKELAKNIEFKEKLEQENEENGSPSREETENMTKERDEDKKKSRRDKYDSVNDEKVKKTDKKRDSAQNNQKKSAKEHRSKNIKEEKTRDKGDGKDITKQKEKMLQDESRKSKMIDKNEEKTIIKDVQKDKKAENVGRDTNEKDGKENNENKRDEKTNMVNTKENDERKSRIENGEKTEVKSKEETKQEPEKNKKTDDKEGTKVTENEGETKGKTEEEETGERKKTEEAATPVKEAHKNGKSQGFLLLKKKGPFSSWKRYYFVLDGQLLTYYRPDQDYVGHLSVLKGSLDLAMLEEVRSKKPGLMKTHFPFRLTRRNLPSLKLAADTREERERWMGLLRDILIRNNRLSAHNSDRTLHTGRPFAHLDSSDQPAFATMPGRGVHSDGTAHLSSSDEDEESKLIRPKKVMRVPIAGPLAGINIAEVNLKKVELPKKATETADDTDSSASDQSDDEPHLVRPRKTSPSIPIGGVKLKKVIREKESEARDADREKMQAGEPLSAGEMFGVKLKKIQTKEEMVRKDVAEDKREEPGAHQKRAMKQANIPLSSGTLLGRTDVKPTKLSPNNQKRSTAERKKSPSPKIPLSKSVHSLTKAVEAPDPKKGLQDATSDEEEVEEEERGEEKKKDEGEEEEKNKKREGEEEEKEEEEQLEKKITIHHAESFEIRCTDEVLSIDPEVVTEIAFVKEDSLACATQEEVRTEDGKQEPPEEQDQESTDAKSPSESPPPAEGSPILLPRVSITVKEHSDEEPEYENLDEEFLKTVREFSDFSFAPQETKSTSQEEEEYEELDEAFLKEAKDIAPVSPTPVSKDSSPNRPPSPYSSITITTPPSNPQDHGEDEYEEIDEDFVNALRTANASPKPLPPVTSSSETLRAPVAKEASAEKGVTPPGSPMRGRTNTNESTNSSCKSDTDGVEKRSSKFKFFRSRRSGSISSSDKKENEETKDSKDNRRGSSTFSKILQGKKSKDKKKKDAKESSAKAGEKSNEIDPEPSRASKHEPEIPVFVEAEKPQDPLQRTDSEATKAIPEVSLPETEEERSETEVETLFPCIMESPESLSVLMRRNTERNGEEEKREATGRCSTYSRASNSSRDHEPAPSIPEKTRVRAKSPGHDVPQSNRPVTALFHLSLPQEQETEDRKPVDGYISEKQIQAILNACETRDRRRLSQTHVHGNALNVPDVGDDRIYQRPSLVSVNSAESDEPLRATNFLSGNRLSTGSGSFKALSKSYDSDSSGELQQASRDPENVFQEQEASGVHLRTAPRLAESLTEGNRVSLTSPEFTVVEEDGPGTPDATKTTFLAAEDLQDSRGKPRFSVGDEGDEEEDYFPVVGGDVELRTSPRNLPLPTSQAGEMRTSGIVELKDYLKKMDPDEEAVEVKSSISRLGHSAAVEKLKETSDQL